MRAFLNRDIYSEAENEILRRFVFPAELHFGDQTVPVRDMRCVWKQLLSVIAARIKMNENVRAQVEQGQFPGISICPCAEAPDADGLFIRFSGDQNGQQQLGCWFAFAEDVCAIRAQVAQWLRAFGFADHMIYLKNEYPEFSHEQNKLGSLDREVYRRVTQGQSALQIALTDDLGEGLDNWYEPALNELRDKIKNNIPGQAGYEPISGILNSTPYASKILWFRIAYEEFDGRDYKKCVADNIRGLIENDLTQFAGNVCGPFPLNNLNQFCNYVWFLAKADGNSNSRLKKGLRAAVRGSDDLDRYEVIATLLNSENDNGNDFRNFVRWFKENRLDDQDVDCWKKRIANDFLKAFPRYDDANADCGYYLHWHKEGSLPPRPIFGISKVQLRNGYDRLEVKLDGQAQPMSLPASLFANDGMYLIPVGEAGVKAVVAKRDGQDCELYPIQGEDILAGDDIANGVFCRAVEGVRDNRRDWWTRLVGEDVVSNRKRELLVVVSGCVDALNVTEANGAEVRWIQCGQPKYYCDVDKTAFVLSVVSRPQNDVKVRIKDWDIKLRLRA